MGRGGGETTALAPLRGAEARIAALLPEGARGYRVGGAVRDALLGRTEKDLDIAVVGIGADELRQIGRGDDLLVAGQLIGVRLKEDWAGPEGIELALARRESSSGPGHSDFSIEADPGIAIEEDLRRRDFTCNALAREILPDGSEGELVDPFGGAGDIERRILRQTHPDAIKEDPLRSLRGLVRVARDGFRIDLETASEMTRSASALAPDGPLSAERVFGELKKIIMAPEAARALALARDLGVYEEIFPELRPTIGFDQKSRYHRMTVDQHCLAALEKACELELDESVRWAALLHDSGKPVSAWAGDDGRLHYYACEDKEGHEEAGARIAGQIMKRLRAPRDLQEEVEFLVREHMWPDDREFAGMRPAKQDLKARRFIRRYGPERARRLIDLRICDNASKGSPATSRLGNTEIFKEVFEHQLEAVTDVSGLKISGRDLLERGFEGPEIGQALEGFLDRIIVDPSLNTRERLLQWSDRLQGRGRR